MAGVVNRFPSYVIQAVRPGLTIPCDIEARVMKAFADKTKYPDTNSVTVEHIRDFRQKHVPHLDGPLYEFTGEDPVRYGKACEKLSESLGNLQDKSPEELLGLCLSLGSILNHTQEPPFRIGYSSISKTTEEQPCPVFNPNDFFTVINRLERTEKTTSFGDWYAFFLRLSHELFLQELLEKSYKDPIGESQVLTDEDKEQLNQLVHLCPLPNAVLKAMSDFCEVFSQKLKSADLDPYELAAFVHLEIVRIHPFKDGNGRLARLLMNAILIRASLPAVYFYSKKEYQEEVRKNFTDPGSFARYLKGKVACFQSLYKEAQATNRAFDSFDSFILDQGVRTLKESGAPGASDSGTIRMVHFSL